MATPQDKKPQEKKPRTLRKFHASGYKAIEELMVEGETDTMVIVGYDSLLKKTIRYKKKSLDEGWFDTWEEAHAFLRDKVKLEVDFSERNLAAWKQTQIEVLALKQEPPTAV